jgi:hypothetical protein
MIRSSLNVGLSSLKKWYEKGTLRYDLSFQRNLGMWSLPVKSMLIWSLLSESYIPPLVFVKGDEEIVDEKGKPVSVYRVLDGAQRTSNLFDYMNDSFRLHGSTPDVEVDGEIYEIAGCLFSELPQELINAINSYKFSIQAISNATDEELTMLFANINSGVALSTVQRAKPEMGSELCNYFREILEKPFFSQGLNLTASQALKEDDLAIALQSLMLMTDYDDYKSISVAECLKFSKYLKNNFAASERNNFNEVIDYLEVFDKKAKYLRKNNVCIIVKLAEEMLYEGIGANEYKNFLNDFFISDNEEYKQFSGSGNVKRPNVEARYNVMRDECYSYFNMEIPDADENQEIDSTDESSDGYDGDNGENSQNNNEVV